MTATEDQARSIFLVALDRAPDGWPALLAESCGDDADLRARVGRLLDAHCAIGSIHGSRGEPTAGAADGPGTVIGPYKLLEVIGEGGMGTVFLARQTEPVKRLVALKVIKAGMDTRQVLARFEAERQALALMDHPHIAKVLDAGATAEGRPYFVMELVKGVPLTEYCDARKLTVRERLGLFVPVCQAVQHAHTKGVIHRDLKPSNVLVALYDDEPVPKVIDFGVAKAAGVQLTEETLVTGVGAVVGTPAYMSPEQARLNNLDVDTRSDIYSLGVLLYELLTGTTPLSSKRVEEAGLLEALRLVREEETVRPSSRLSTVDELPGIAASRGVEPKKLSGLVRGELDWVVMKALEKDRSRRYETAAALAQDVQRYLADEPVQACPPSAGYRLRKFARRHRQGLAVGGLAAVFVVLAGAGAGWVVRDRAARRADADRERAEREAETEREKAIRQAVLEREGSLALEEMGQLRRRQKYREALTVARLEESKLSGDGGLDELLSHVRQQRTDLEMYIRLESIRIARTSGGAKERYVVSQEETDRNYRQAFRDDGIDAEALTPDAVANRVRARTIRLELAAALDDWASTRTAHWKHLLAVARAVDPDPWRQQVREAVEQKDLATLKRLAGSDQFVTLPVPTVVTLGKALMDQRAYEDAAAFLEKAQRQNPGDFWINHKLGTCFRLRKPPDSDQEVRYFTAALAVRPDDCQCRSDVAEALLRQGRHDQAVAIYSKNIELEPDNWLHWSNRAVAFGRSRKWAEAIADHSKALELRPDHAHSWHGRAVGYARLGKWAQAVPDYSRAIELKPAYILWWYERGMAFEQLRQWDEAMADFSKAIAFQPDFGWAWGKRGYVCARLAQWEPAVADYSKAVALLAGRRDIGWMHADRALVNTKLGRFADALADYEKALEMEPDKPASSNNLAWFLATCPEENLLAPRRAVQLAQEAVKLSPEMGIFWNTLGAAHYRAGDWKAAVTALRKARDLRFGGSVNCYFLAMAHWRLEEKESAHKWYDEAVRMHTSKVSTDELRRLRDQAAGLLGITAPGLDGGPQKGPIPKPPDSEGGGRKA